MITLAHLRDANLARLPLFRSATGAPAHDAVDGSDWTLLEWCGALSGEVGELCEAVELLNTPMRGIEASARDFAGVRGEIADVICYADIVAMRAGIVLDDSYFARASASGPYAMFALSQRVAATTGAIANTAKKIRRGDKPVDAVRDELARLLADTLGYLGRMCEWLGESPMALVFAKWNAVSERIGIDLRIEGDGTISGTRYVAPRRTRVIALLGPAGAGKSTIAAHLAERYGATRYLFSDLLKTIAMRTLDFTRAQCYGTQAEKEAIDPRYGFSPRTFLQKLGTEGIRNTLGRDFWIRATLAQIAAEAPDLAVIEDARFVNETAAIRACGGHVWRVVRPGDRGSTADQTHASEAEIAAAFSAEVDDSIAPEVFGVPELLRCVDVLAHLRELDK